MSVHLKPKFRCLSSSINRRTCSSSFNVRKMMFDPSLSNLTNLLSDWYSVFNVQCSIFVQKNRKIGFWIAGLKTREFLGLCVISFPIKILMYIWKCSDSVKDLMKCNRKFMYHIEIDSWLSIRRKISSISNVSN